MLHSHLCDGPVRPWTWRRIRQFQIALWGITLLCPALLVRGLYNNHRDRQSLQWPTVSSQYFASGFMIPIINYQMNEFGLSLIPFIVGIGFLFFNGKSLWGWLLSVAGLGIIIAGILMSLHIYFRPTSLFNTLMMLVLLFGGVGLIARSLKAMPATPKEEQKPR